MVSLEIQYEEPWWLKFSHTLLFILSYFAPGCFCFSQFIFPFDSPSKWQCYSVQKRTQANRRREEWKGEEINVTLKGLENLPNGEIFLEFLNCELAASVWFWTLAFLGNWTEIDYWFPYKNVILLHWTNCENNTFLQKSKFFFYDNWQTFKTVVIFGFC